LQDLQYIQIVLGFSGPVSKQFYMCMGHGLDCWTLVHILVRVNDSR